MLKGGTLFQGKDLGRKTHHDTKEEREKGKEPLRLVRILKSSGTPRMDFCYPAKQKGNRESVVKPLGSLVSPRAGQGKSLKPSPAGR